MRAGPMRHRVAVQSPAESRATDGSVALSWTTLFTAWASVEQQQAGEQWDAGQTRPSASYTVTIRYRAMATARCRLLWDGRVLNIRGVVFDSQKRQMALDCVEER